MKRHKYGAVKTEVDGIVFASKKEAKRYQELKLLRKAGKIAALELQPSFDLVVNGVKVGRYVADFRYAEQDLEVVEDAKGYKTDIYRLKKKMVEAQYGIEIREV
jgi:hypothetical protein